MGRQLQRGLKCSGFSDIRILDARYLLQAITPDGRRVLLIADPAKKPTTITASAANTG